MQKAMMTKCDSTTIRNFLIFNCIFQRLRRQNVNDVIRCDFMKFIHIHTRMYITQRMALESSRNEIFFTISFLMIVKILHQINFSYDESEMSEMLNQMLNDIEMK